MTEASPWRENLRCHIYESGREIKGQRNDLKDSVFYLAAQRLPFQAATPFAAIPLILQGTFTPITEGEYSDELTRLIYSVMSTRCVLFFWQTTRYAWDVCAMWTCCYLSYTHMHTHSFISPFPPAPLPLHLAASPPDPAERPTVPPPAAAACKRQSYLLLGARYLFLGQSFSWAAKKEERGKEKKAERVKGRKSRGGGSNWLIAQ